MEASQELKKESARKKVIKRNIAGFLFIGPWLLGFLGYILGPMIASLYLSFTNYDMLSSASWVGLQNYIQMFTQDPRFLKSMQVTLVFVFFSVPLKLAFALFVAMLFNTPFRFQKVYTIVYYVPSILGGSVAVAVMWRQLFSGDGAVNDILANIGLGSLTVDWINNPDYALSVIVLLIVWQFGAPMLIFLAGLKNIPKELYEAAAVDGANFITRFFRITIPMLTPIIFFNLIMQMINGFMIFTQGYLITGGGPLDETLFVSLYLYESAFEYYKMGYASAMAWIMLLVIAFFTAILFKTSKSWVFYEA